jgi:hypothetical protein
MPVTTVQLADKQGYVYLPSNYDKTKAYPCMLFFPGSGEINGAITALNVHGPMLYLNKPGVDLGLDLIVIAVQNISAPQVYINAIKALYKVSTIIATGLSLGNQAWMEFAFTGAANFAQIGAFFMFSCDPEYGAAVRDPTLFPKYHAFYYGGCGDQDAFYNMANVGMLELFNAIKALNPSLCDFDVWKGAGHGDPVWSDGYNPAWKSPTMGMSIYAKAASLYPVAAPVVVPPVTPPVTPPAKTVTGIKIEFSDGTEQDVSTVTIIYTVGQPAPL